MSTDRTSEFIQALRTLERDGDVEPIATLFADDAVVGNVSLREPLQGADGAREFWQDYRSTFERIESDFAEVIGEGDASALEWRSTGTLSSGDDFEYQGVSVIEWDGDRIRRFTAYFDPTALGLQPTQAR